MDGIICLRAILKTKTNEIVIGPLITLIAFVRVIRIHLQKLTSMLSRILSKCLYSCSFFYWCLYIDSISHEIVIVLILNPRCNVHELDWLKPSLISIIDISLSNRDSVVNDVWTSMFDIQKRWHREKENFRRNRAMQCKGKRAYVVMALKCYTYGLESSQWWCHRLPQIWELMAALLKKINCRL